MAVWAHVACRQLQAHMDPVLLCGVQPLLLGRLLQVLCGCILHQAHVSAAAVVILKAAQGNSAYLLLSGDALVHLWVLRTCQQVYAVHLHDDRRAPKAPPWHLHALITKYTIPEWAMQLSYSKI